MTAHGNSIFKLLEDDSQDRVNLVMVVMWT